MRFLRLFLLWLAAAAALALPAGLEAAATATAALSDPSVAVGQAVELEVTITGARSANLPGDIKVDGLTITRESRQSSSSSFNFTFGGNGANTSSSSVTYYYAIVPHKAGTFQIPSITARVGNETAATAPVTLTVGQSASAAAPAAPGTPADPDASPGEEPKLAFAELIIPKQNVYVGEAVPVELRFYFNPNISVHIQQPPQIGGDGFALQKFTDARQDNVTKDGQNFVMLTFKTALTPAKAGKLPIGPAELDCIASVRASTKRLQHFNDPFFNDPLFNNLLNGMSLHREKLEVKSDPQDLEVKPLPAGAPKEFSGAVGQFTMAPPDASPTRVKVGDPVTLKLKITGRGNFDQVSLPKMLSDPGWRSYPPSTNFKADDDLGISGTKSFDIALIPDQRQERLPAVAFAFFDPIKEEYVTLKSEQAPIAVEGQANPSQPPAAPPQTVAAASQSSSPAASATPPAASDILYIRTDRGTWGGSFTPMYATREFWLAQLVPAFLLLVIGVWKSRRTRVADLAAQRAAGLRREKAELMRALQQGNLDYPAFVDTAVKYIQAGAALTSGGNAASIGPEEACAARDLDPASVAVVRDLFAVQGEARYAGVAAGSGRSLSDGERSDILKTLKNFEDNNGRK